MESIEIARPHDSSIEGVHSWIFASSDSSVVNYTCALHPTPDGKGGIVDGCRARACVRPRMILEEKFPGGTISKPTGKQWS